PLIHSRLAMAVFVALGDVTWLDGAAGGPAAPPDRVLSGPRGNVEVQGQDGLQAGCRGKAWGPASRVTPACFGWFGPDPLLPGGRHLRGQVQRGYAVGGVVDVFP